MAIRSDYPRPIMVNGYVCRNCDDVSDAKKFIDPSKPKTGPVSEPQAAGNDAQRAVSFGGTLSFRNAAPSASLLPGAAEARQRYDKVA